MKTILVATDFSAEATYALHVARQLAQHTGAALTLLHVVEPPGATAPITAEALAAAIVRLLTDPAGAAELARQGHAFVAQHYDWAGATAPLNALLSSPV